jgi:hypothetical protein
MRLMHIFVFAAVATLAGCAIGPTPQTPKQFRDGVAKGGFGTMHETYQVAGPYRRVSARMKRKAAECLNRTMTLQSCINGSCSNTDYIFHSRFNESRHGSELDVQLKLEPDHSIYLGGKPPKGGMYVAVADIMPASDGKTSIAMYGTDMGMFKYIPIAVKHWADNSNLGCPDFSAGM